MVNGLPPHQAACEPFHEELLKCYEENPFLRFTGVCSQHVRDLQKCIRKQFDLRQAEQAKEFRESQKRFKKNLESKVE